MLTLECVWGEEDSDNAGVVLRWKADLLMYPCVLLLYRFSVCQVTVMQWMSSQTTAIGLSLWRSCKSPIIAHHVCTAGVQMRHIVT